MINFFVETKLEYTTQLVNVLTPLIYEGVQSIYTESLKISNESNNVLKVFQSFLKRIPKWNDEMIKQESDRIMNNTKSYTWLSDLIKATVKANIIVLTYNPSCVKMQTKIDPKFYQTIKIEDFIHKIYNECARELWNNPYLMYHNYPAIELKRNQRDTIHLIKDSIKEAIRKLLPVKEILELYLGEELEPNLPNDHFEKNISEVDERNIQKLIRKELFNDNTLISSKLIEDKLPETKLLENKLPETKLPETKLPENKLLETKLPVIDNKLVEENIAEIKGGGVKDLESKILDIINKDTSELSLSNIKPRNNTTSESKTSEVSKMKSKQESIKQTIDDKIKNILEKNLGETDLNTSLSYRAETNEKDYQEIFSNNAGGGVVIDNKKNSEKDSSKSKRKFFNNYLNF